MTDTFEPYGRDDTEEIPVVAMRHRIVWWRVAALALITAAAASGSYLAFTGPSRPAHETAASPEAPAPAPLPSGPRVGDLRNLLAFADPVPPTPEPTPQPQPVRRRSSSSSSGTTRSRPAPKPDNPFRNLPGGGPLEDLCAGGRCD